jgi:hypothetical protein
MDKGRCCRRPFKSRKKAARGKTVDLGSNGCFSFKAAFCLVDGCWPMQEAGRFLLAPDWANQQLR